MNKTIATVIVSLTCMLGLSACGGLIRVQRAVEDKGYDVEKVGVRSDGSGKTVTVYVEDNLDATQKQEVVDTAKEAYPNAKNWEVAKATGEGVGSSSSGSKSSGSKPNSGARPNH